MPGGTKVCLAIYLVSGHGDSGATLFCFFYFLFFAMLERNYTFIIYIISTSLKIIE